MRKASEILLGLNWEKEKEKQSYADYNRVIESFSSKTIKESLDKAKSLFGVKVFTLKNSHPVSGQFSITPELTTEIRLKKNFHNSSVALHEMSHMADYLAGNLPLPDPIDSFLEMITGKKSDVAIIQYSEAEVVAESCSLIVSKQIFNSEELLKAQSLYIKEWVENIEKHSVENNIERLLDRIDSAVEILSQVIEPQ